MKATPSQIVKTSLLYDQVVSSTPASGTIAKMGQEAAAGIALLKQEVAEIEYIEIRPPLVAATGAAEALEQIKLIIDGKEWYGEQFLIRADNDSLISPARMNVSNELTGIAEGTRKIFTLGTSLPDLLKQGVQNNPQLILQNTTPKVREAGTINVEYMIGNSAITGTFRVLMYGRKYTNLSVAQWYMNQVYGGVKSVPLVDAVTGRDFSTAIAPQSLDVKDWTSLIGGIDMKLQGGVEVKPFLRWARNDTATTVSKEYALSYAQGQVANPENNLSIEVAEDTLYYINKVGLREHSNHLELIAYANNVEIFRERVRNSINNFKFGRNTSNGVNVTVAEHEYIPLPEIKYPIFGHNETLEFRILDNGSAIADGTAFGAGDLVVVAGCTIKDPNYKSDKPLVIN